MKLAIELARESYAPGEVVSGSVSVVRPGPARTLTVRLGYEERTRAYREVTRAVEGAVLATGELLAGASFPFAIALPADALPGHTSTNGRLGWVVEAHVDRRGRDVREVRPIDVRLRA